MIILITKYLGGMLLNCLAQPILYNNSKTYFSSEEFKKAPLLLCHKNAMDGKVLPINWSGRMFGTQEILREVQQNKCMMKTVSTQTLCPNEHFNFNMVDCEEFQYKSNNIEITAIPWDKEYMIYLIKDGNVVNLLTDIITEDLSVFIENKILRNAVKSGIDVLYINDGVYHQSEELKLFPSECLLGALVTIVQPHFVKGLLREEELPQHIVNCCVELSGE